MPWHPYNWKKESMICILCYAQSKGAAMEEAVAVLKGETVCSKHLEERAQKLESKLQDRPEVTPH